MSAPACAHPLRTMGAVCCERCEREAIVFIELARDCALPCMAHPCRCAVEAARLANPPRQLGLGGVA